MSINISIIVRDRIKQLNQYKAEGIFIINGGHQLNADGTIKYFDLKLYKNNLEIPYVSKDKVKSEFPIPPVFLPR